MDVYKKTRKHKNNSYKVLTQTRKKTMGKNKKKLPPKLTERQRKYYRYVKEKGRGTEVYNFYFNLAQKYAKECKRDEK